MLIINHSFLFIRILVVYLFFFFFQAEDGIRDLTVTGVQTCALPISWRSQQIHGVDTIMIWIARGEMLQWDSILGHYPSDLEDKQPCSYHRDVWSKKIGRASCRERV